MPNILIVGATGYIGRALTHTLTSSGLHTVYGIVRTPAKSTSLALEEVKSILCPDPVADPEPYLRAIRVHDIDTVVDCSAASSGTLKILADLRAVGHERLEKAKAAGQARCQKLGFVFVSGMWVHGGGSGGRDKVSDLDAVGTSLEKRRPMKLVEKRAEAEQEILRAGDVLDVMIIRPALVYGRGSWILEPVLGPLIKAAKEGGLGTVEVNVALESAPGLVHVDDVGSGLRCAVEKLHELAGTGVYPVFDLQSAQQSYLSIVGNAKRILGYKGDVQLVGPEAGNPFSEAMSASLNAGGERAKLLLGWQPKRTKNINGELDVYLAALAAWMEGAK